MKNTVMTWVMMSAALSCLAIQTANAANTWYVDDDNYGKPDLTGKSEALAYGTIQDAIAKASSGDTIYVAPGVYSNGTGAAVSSWGASRIGWNNKRFYIYSTGNASNTIIIGNKSAETDLGIGADAMRCLAIYDNSGTSCTGTILKGFTFMGGSTVNDSSNYRARCGGAVCVSHNQIYFVDCVFQDCSAKHGGGAAYKGTFVRCLFTRNSVSDSASYGVCWGDGNQVQLYSCVLHHNTYGTSNGASSGTLFSYVTAVNCTIVDNAFNKCSNSANESFYNTVFFQSGTYDASSTFANCVKESDEPRSVMSTIIPDVRLLPNRLQGLWRQLACLVRNNCCRRDSDRRDACCRRHCRKGRCRNREWNGALPVGRVFVRVPGRLSDAVCFHSRCAGGKAPLAFPFQGESAVRKRLSIP